MDHDPFWKHQHSGAIAHVPGRLLQRIAGARATAAFDQDVLDNKAAVAHGRLKMPVLAVGGDHSLGPTMAYIMRFAADDVREVVIKDSGHWLMEEQPQATVAAIAGFLSADPPDGCKQPVG